VPVAELKASSASGELNSSVFDSLISDDPIDDLRSWLSDLKGTRDRREPGRWDTLCSRCLADYGLDPYYTKSGNFVRTCSTGFVDWAR
jgi:hypothetical protein